MGEVEDCGEGEAETEDGSGSGEDHGPNFIGPGKNKVDNH